MVVGTGVAMVETGRLMRPSVGSSGVIGGPENSSWVGTVGENFTVVQHWRVGRATWVGVVGE